METSDTSKTPFRHRAEYDEGMDYYNTPLRLSDGGGSGGAADAADTPARRCVDGTILFNLARVHNNQGNYGDALELYKRSLRTLEKWPYSGDPTLTMAILFGIGQIQYVRGDHSDSLKTYRTSLSFARANFGDRSIEVAACLNCVGVLHYIMPKGDSLQALEALNRSVELRKLILGDHDISVGTTYNNIGRIHFQLGDYEEAMEAYRCALRIRRKEQGESVDVAATIFNIGQVFHQQGDRDRALRHYREFLSLAKKHFGDFHRDICIVTTW